MLSTEIKALITTRFCAYHNSIAVVVGAKFVMAEWPEIQEF